MLSKSKFILYLRCPKAYEYYYVKNNEMIETEAMKKGKQTHEFIENFFRRLEFNDGQPVFPDVSNELHFIQNFISFEKKRWKATQNIEEYMPIALEKKYVSEKLEMNGIVDRIHKNGSDIIIIENKCSAPFMSTLLDLELLFYKVLTDEFNINANSYAVYFATNNTVQIRNITSQKMVMINNAINKVKEGIKNQEFECEKENCLHERVHENFIG